MPGAWHNKVTHRQYLHQQQTTTAQHRWWKQRTGAHKHLQHRAAGTELHWYCCVCQVTLLDPVRFPGAIKVFAREICRNDLLNFGRLHFFFPDSRLVELSGGGSACQSA